MAYVFAETTSLEGVREHAVGAAAGLEAHEELKAFVPLWDKRTEEIDARIGARDAARDKVVRARVLTRVRDATWDAALGDLSGRAFLAAGKSAAERPYADLFGGVTARDAQDLGAAKATAFGDQVLATAATLAHPDLAESVERFRKANDALKLAHAARTEAEIAELQHDILRRRELDASELLIAKTEIEILKAFPGRKDLVRAILSPWEPPRRRTAQSEPAAPL